MATQPVPRTHQAAADRCATCNGLLTTSYYTLLDRPERYCPTCIATRPRCDCCGAPLGSSSWRLHDGRLQCPICHSTAVYDPAVARRIFDETVAAVIAQLNLTLNVGVEFRLVDAPTLKGIRARGKGQSIEEQPITLGLYQRQGHVRAIYMLYGLPLLLFRITVAHEYAHAWQGERCPLLEDDELREGFAEWVAYRHLQWLGCTRAAQRMLNSHHPYRPALERVLALEQEMGSVGLIEYIKRVE